MQSRILVIDPSIAGISGDMVVSAAIDLGADQKRTVDAMLSAKKYVRGCSKLEIKVRDIVKQGFRAKHLVVDAKESVHERRASEMMEALKDSLSALGLSKSAEKFAINTLKTLADAEGRLHGENTGNVHLHEAGSIDTIVDILGSACAFDDLGIIDGARVLTTPVAVGGGSFSFSHGKVASPGPAVLEIAKQYKLPIVGGPVQAELATPTGVALLANLVDETIKFYPKMKPLAVGIGAGRRDFKTVPNVLRLTLGESISKMPAEEIAILETNLDDITGEHLAHASEVLMDSGAKDVTIIPSLTKKGRPGYLLRVIVGTSKADDLAEKMMLETGTLGVRIITAIRHVASRNIVKVPVKIGGKRFSVDVKVSRNARGDVIAIKPEYEAIKRLAKKLDVPVIRLAGEVQSQVSANFFNGRLLSAGDIRSEQEANRNQHRQKS
ncbi:MAG: nickel pincer cofactor biosynthesis protein LarC [Thaumarchaeota archaeon]|nr:nickel pincer cofactor biosynthesis protein LarC [Nitrososphaerota archaeon]